MRKWGVGVNWVAGLRKHNANSNSMSPREREFLEAGHDLAMILGRGARVRRTSQMQTLDIFLESVKKTFGDLDRARMAHTQLHELKMTSGTTAEDYTA